MYAPIPVGVDRRKDGLAVSPGVEVPAGALRISTPRFVQRGNPHQAIGVVIGQRSQQRPIDDAEDRDARAHAQRDREHGGEREPAGAKEAPCGKTNGRHAKNLAQLVPGGQPYVSRWKRGAGGWRLEAGNSHWKLETGNWNW